MTRTLSRSQIQRLEAFRISRRLSIPQLKLAMAAPFRWPVLFRAIRHQGRISEETYRFIVEWLEKFVPEKAVPDGKAAAANDAIPCSE
jgi:hypothetical protein